MNALPPRRPPTPAALLQGAERARAFEERVPPRVGAPPRFFSNEELAKLWRQGAREGGLREIQRTALFFARPSFPLEEVSVWTSDAQGQKRAQSRPVASRGDWVGFWRFESHTHAWLISPAEFTKARALDDLSAEAFAGSSRWLAPLLGLDEEVELAQADRDAMAAHLREVGRHKAPKAPPSAQRERPLLPLFPRFDMPAAPRIGILIRQPIYFAGPRGAICFAGPGAVLLCSPGVDAEKGRDWRFDAVNPFELAAGWRCSDPLLLAESRALFAQDRTPRPPMAPLPSLGPELGEQSDFGGSAEALAPEEAPFSFRSQNDYRDDAEPDLEQFALLAAASALRAGPASRHLPPRGEPALDESPTEEIPMPGIFGYLKPEPAAPRQPAAPAANAKPAAQAKPSDSPLAALFAKPAAPAEPADKPLAALFAQWQGVGGASERASPAPAQPEPSTGEKPLPELFAQLRGESIAKGGAPETAPQPAALPSVFKRLRG